MKSSINKDLLINHFLGKSSPLQKRMIQEWLQLAKNQERYYEWLAEFERQHPQFIPDPSEKIETYVKHMQMHPDGLALSSGSMEDTNREASQLKTQHKTWLAAAAMVLILLVWSVSLKDNLWYHTYRTAYNNLKKVTLEDGSQIVMNSNTTLMIPRFSFYPKERRVILKGEASFSVSHRSNHAKFVVETDNNLHVVVLGTEFTVNSRKRGDQIHLSKGSIRLEYRHDKEKKTLLMSPGDLVMRNGEGKVEKRKVTVHQGLSDWIHHRFTFDGASMQELQFMLEDNYGINLKLAGKELEEFSLHGSYRASSAEELIMALTKAAQLKYHKSNDTITITYP
ncbi:FecR family protein [Dyadobacter tibetensis]|uniref:FecR family protein n=1 Tax=Dyadobacter tibetensis TaxID=1211851 RepID=UPI000470C3B9|nr:FecR family protein [Dyadobacter tibetensis]